MLESKRCERCGGSRYTRDQYGNIICAYCNENYGKRDDIGGYEQNNLSVKVAWSEPEKSADEIVPGWISTTSGILTLGAVILDLWMVAKSPLTSQFAPFMAVTIILWFIVALLRVYTMFSYEKERKAIDFGILGLSLCIVTAKLFFLIALL